MAVALVAILAVRIVLAERAEAARLAERGATGRVAEGPVKEVPHCQMTNATRLRMTQITERDFDSRASHFITCCPALLRPVSTYEKAGDRDCGLTLGAV